MDTSLLLSVKHLNVKYNLRGFLRFHSLQEKLTLEDVSFAVKKGETLGIVGESGSGKSTLAKAILKLIPVHSGKIIFEHTDLTALTQKQFVPWRKKIQMIFQDPFESLNPRMSVYQILLEPIQIHFKNLSSFQKKRYIFELLNYVQLPKTVIHKHPNEFSGGQRQRICIARALAVKPELLICDEPVSALDVSIQAQIINLLKDLQKLLNMTYLFISHDMALVRHMSNQVAVLQAGKLVEYGSVDEIYKHPKTLYTQKLLDAIPEIF